MQIKDVEISKIKSVVDNHRNPALFAKSLDEMKESLAKEGMKVPIKVAEAKDGYELVYGHRRLTAASMLGWRVIPAVIALPMTLEQIKIEQALENIGRANLTPVEEAFCLKGLVEGGKDIAEAVKVMGKTVTWARKRMDLFRLDKKVLELVESGRIPLEHAFIISRIGDPNVQRDIAKAVCGEMFGDSLEKAAASSDYISPLKHVRQFVAARLRNLGAQHWPMDIPYAGMVACNGCVNNTATEPYLFAGMSGIGKRGACTFEGCFTKKMKAFEQEAKRKKKDKPQHKAEPRVTKEQAEKNALAKLKAEHWPWTAEQKSAVARFKRAIKGYEAIVQAFHSGKLRDMMAVVIMALYSNDARDVTLKAIVNAKDGMIPRKTMDYYLEQIASISDWMEPGMNSDEMNTPAYNEDFIRTEELIEGLAKKWKIQLPPRPQPSDFKDEPLKKEKK